MAPAEAEVKESTGQDIYFLDRSGSMQGMKWPKAVQTFAEFVKTLGPRDRVWATFFEEKFRDFAEAPLPAATVLADPGLRELEALGTGGGTELLPALLHVLAKVREHSVIPPLLTAWQNEVTALPRGQRYHRLMEVLAEWIVEKPGEALDTLMRLKALLAELKRVASDDAAVVLNLRHWIGRYVEHPSKPRECALEELALLDRLAAKA